MSRHEWESGTIKLPAAAYADVRRAVADAVTKRSTRQHELSQQLWAQCTAADKKTPETIATAQRRFAATLSGRDQQLVDDLYWGRGTPKRKLKTDFLIPTNKTTDFAEVEAGITFNPGDKSLRWDSGENNHAVDTAHETEIWNALQGALGQVQWTRGTGGSLTGNDEYNRDADWAGGGANYTTGGYGPIGAEEAPGHTSPFRMADGILVRREDFEKVAKSAEQARRRQWKKEAEAHQQARHGAGAPASRGGQFRVTSRGESARGLGW